MLTPNSYKMYINAPRNYDGNTYFTVKKAYLKKLKAFYNFPIANNFFRIYCIWPY